MARPDIISRWTETLQFAVVSTPRRLRLTSEKDGGNADRWKPVDYCEIDNRGNKGAILYYAFNGRTASSSLATAAPATISQPQFRLPPDAIDRVFIRATSISVISTSNSTTIFVTSGIY